MGVLHQLVAGGRQRWRASTKADRFRLLVLAVSIPLAMAGAIVVYPAHEGMVVLCEDLDAVTAQRVQDVLHARGIPYATTAGGQTIWVPAAVDAELIVELPHIARQPGVATLDETAEPPGSAT